MEVKENGSLSAMSNYLNHEFWSGRAFDISSRDPDNPYDHGSDGVIRYSVLANAYDANGITEDRALMVQNVLTYLGNVTGIEFSPLKAHEDPGLNSNTLYFSDLNDFGGGKPGGGANGINYTQINIPANWGGGNLGGPGKISQDILHETLHGMGLGHTGPYNGTGSFDISAKYSTDTWQNSVMSYFPQTSTNAVTNPPDSTRDNPLTLMAVDALAIDDFYGSQEGTDGKQFGTKVAYTDDTTYGFNTNVTDPILSQIAVNGDKNAFTIIDGGGVDTINVSGWSDNQRIDLTPSNENNISPTTSDIAGEKGNLALAVGTVVENAATGSGNDLVIGNDAQNNIWSGAGNDTVVGGNGNDFIDDSGGVDVLDGGNGDDTASYYNVGSRVEVDFSANANNQNDQLINIEGVQGSNYADDRLAGNNDANKLWGAGGNDYLLGLNGNDSLSGDDGDDRLEGATGDDYLDGGNGNDALFGHHGMDTLIGGAGNDWMDGENDNDTLWGGEGDDSIAGGLGDDEMHGDSGNDRFFGEEGNDRIFGEAGDDRLEGAWGDDSLDGGDGNDVMYGFDGNDMLVGGAGEDTLIGELGDDELHGNDGNDLFYCEDGDDRAFGDAGDDRLEGAQGNDYLDGGDGNDIIFGYYGADTLAGGAGNDTILGEYDNDELHGGSGADEFHFKGNDGYDIIYDFEDGVDKLAFYGSIGINDISVTAQADGTLLQSGYGSILLANIATEQVDVTDYLFGLV